MNPCSPNSFQRPIASCALLFLAALSSLSINAQVIRIVDQSTDAPIPYITLRSLEGPGGYVADASGKIIFEHQAQEEDRFELSCIGYTSRIVNFADISKSDTLQMRPQHLELSEVIVKPISAADFVLQAMEALPMNYTNDSTEVEAYFSQLLRENEHFLYRNEAWLDVEQPGYQADKDTFLIDLVAGKISSVQELEFMRKEVEKDLKKEEKRAKKSGEPLSEEDRGINWEVVNPLLMLRLDPMRHPETPIHVNDNNADFLDAESHEDYTFWYGKPERFGDKTLVVVHFDQREKVKASLFKGTLWIDQESLAFIKVAFGFSESGLKHLVPGYAEALLWVIGLKYDIKETLIEFNYQPRNGRWTLQRSHLKAKVDLEKRRLFSENEFGEFIYQSELIVSEPEFKEVHSWALPLDPKEALSKQIEVLEQNPWSTFEPRKRTIRN